MFRWDPTDGSYDVGVIFIRMQEEQDYWFDHPHEDVSMAEVFCNDDGDTGDMYMRFFTDGE